ncbi:hypothetical protein QS306_12600 [Paraburkholderia bonniea]|uniref:hypothetical protein n=1 Tax=Paraburkholderia bonniea TaxID=2152891 RepID=UPI001291EE05|nr:hypothetical protein [Paraburkholderia bonniea]WJF89930.1 hypothetical protein QS306_12600 [Paraburkholderia bonniea]WJF93244.1 hypothetical protein QS308_12610 [Paraburkholderia bonniea]
MSRKQLVMAVIAASCIGTAHANEVTTLVCNGSGFVSDTQTTQAQEYSYQSHSFEKSVTGTTSVRKPFSGTANVEISAGSVRLKLPRDLVPVISDGRDAWYVLNNPFVGDHEITGNLRFNVLNKPKVRIDRMTGQISIASGFGEFNGNCTAIDQNAAPKF